MSTIRRQSIISSGIIYFGFALGFLNVLLLTKGLTPSQYGLTNVFIALANIIFSFANLGVQAYIAKFYPYYGDNLSVKENDLMTWSFVVSFVGFLIVLTAGLFFRGYIIKVYAAQSPELVKYYYWIFPFGFGLTFYSLLEVYAWHLKKSILTSYLREMQWRIFIFILIGLFFLGVLKSFDLFIKLYAMTYLALAIILLVFLVATGKLSFTLSPSRVSKKFFRRIVARSATIWGGTLLTNVSTYFGALVIASVVPEGLAGAGVYALAQNITSLVQAPQRSILAASVGPLAQAWKDKDYGKINRIYKRSSINLLIFSVGLFTLIWINFSDGVLTFKLKTEYLDAKNVFFFMGLWRIVDMGTGVNAQIIGTSRLWRFDFFTGLVLALLTLPMNYILTRSMGVIGPAVADLITFSVYNGIRWLFLFRNFNMQPFTLASLYTLLLALAGYFICNALFGKYQGLPWLIIRSTVFIGIYGAGVVLLRLSEDVMPVWRTLLKKLGLAGR